MLRFLRRAYVEESGIAMALAVMVMVIVGVMGAGLLVFVSNDLESVVEVNQGQSAFDIADAGSQAAKQQILSDKTPGHYDIEGGSPSCDSSEESPDRIGKNWSPQDEDPGGADEDLAGEGRSFAGGNFDVTIQWLNQDPSADTSCVAPETTSSPEDGVEYFRVISTGTFGDATRRVEAIYETYSLDVPRAYYTPGPITINGTACIEQVSLFSLSEVRFTGSGGCTSGHMEGEDLAYGDWNNPPSDEFNDTARPTTNAGVGTTGEIINSTALGTRDFHGSMTNPTNPKFVQTPTSPQPATEITFPFDFEEELDANRLCDEAKNQGSANYIADNGSGNATLNSWPDSNPGTVVCYEFTDGNANHTLNWAVDDGPDELTGQDALDYPDCEGPIQDGTLVIKGGGFAVKPNSDLLRGVVVVRGSTESTEVETNAAGVGGNGCLDGFINSTGPITLSGNVTPSTSAEANNRPGFFGARVWSWRELYE